MPISFSPFPPLPPFPPFLHRSDHCDDRRKKRNSYEGRRFAISSFLPSPFFPSSIGQQQAGTQVKLTMVIFYGLSRRALNPLPLPYLSPLFLPFPARRLRKDRRNKQIVQVAPAFSPFFSFFFPPAALVEKEFSTKPRAQSPLLSLFGSFFPFPFLFLMINTTIQMVDFCQIIGHSSNTDAYAFPPSSPSSSPSSHSCWRHVLVGEKGEQLAGYLSLPPFFFKIPPPSLLPDSRREQAT